MGKQSKFYENEGKVPFRDLVKDVIMGIVLISGASIFSIRNSLIWIAG
jgi:hypothetical protein